ncbi:MAG: LLM class flavin-dependent oxidoreductase [Acidobacteriota bacterium]|nr:LLM class flavin-dependent oxidoreductase [Acidobacteriota bacterium]
MKLDLLYEFQPRPRPWAKPHPYGQREAEQRCYDEAIEEIQFADRLGFNTVWVVEHHFRDGRSASPCSEAILGGLALSTERIKLGFGVTLTPFGFIHPARLAEKVATVDVLSHGRVEWGTGRSTPMEQTAFGVPPDDRSRAQWREAIEIVVSMWEQERFSWNSENLVFPERVQTPKPYQDPHPPVWQAAASLTSAVSAGELGLGLLSFALLQPVEKMAEHIRAYRRAQATARPGDMLTRVRNDRVGVYTLVHCYDDADEATAYGLWDSVNWWYRHLAEFTLEWELPHLSEDEKDQVFPLLQPVIRGEVPVEHYQKEDMIIVGTPDECLDKILRYASVGVDELLCYVQFGDLPHEKVMRTLELLATEVIPQLEQRGHHVGANARV